MKSKSKYIIINLSLILLFTVSMIQSNLSIKSSSRDISQTPLNSEFIYYDLIFSSDAEVDSYFLGNGTDGLSYATAYNFNSSHINSIDIQDTTRYIRIENCSFDHGTFSLDNVCNIWIESCEFKALNALEIDYTYSTSMNLTIFNSTFAWDNNDNPIFDFKAGINLNFTKNNFSKGKNVIDLIETTGIIENLSFYDNYFYQSDYSIYMSNDINNWVIKNNTFVQMRYGIGFIGNYKNYTGIIQNNTFYQFYYAGIDIRKGNNITITTNVMIYASRKMVNIMECNRINLTNNHFSQGDSLLYFELSHQILLDNNTIEMAQTYLLSFVGSNFITLKNNFINATYGDCIRLVNSRFSTINNNFISTGDIGLYLIDSPDNIISNNIFNSNYYSIVFEESSNPIRIGNCSMTHNIFEITYLIFLFTCDDNDFTWDYNFYDDYSGKYPNVYNNGYYWLTPYQVDPYLAKVIFDFHPLVNREGSFSNNNPQVYIIGKSIYNTTLEENLIIKWDIIDYSITSGSFIKLYRNNTLIKHTSLTSLRFEYTITNLTDGIYYFTLSVYDGFNTDVINSTIIVIIDSNKINATITESNWKYWLIIIGISVGAITGVSVLVYYLYRRKKGLNFIDTK